MISDIKTALSDCGRNNTVEVIYKVLSANLRNTDRTDPRLTSVRQLAQQFGVARQTMQKVYHKLEEEGMIIRTPGKRIWSINNFQRKQTRCIGFILPVSFGEYFMPGTEYGHRHFRMYSGIIDRAAELDYASIPLFLPPPNASKEVIDQAIAKIKEQCCGIIHFGNRGYAVDAPLERVLRLEELAQISFTCEFDHFNIGAVTFDPDHAAQISFNYLREYGHRHICLVYIKTKSKSSFAGSVMNHPDDIRTRFVRVGMLPENISEIPVDIDNIRNSLTSGFKAILKKENSPTAFWCRNDVMAFELISIIRAAGFRVPDDFSVIGFDNHIDSATCDPPLSTFNNPFYEMGITVVNRLIEYMKGGVTPDNRITRLPPMLISRNSVGPIRTINYYLS